MGVNTTWELLNTLTPAVPYLDRVVEEIETSFISVQPSQHGLRRSRSTGTHGLIEMHKEAHLLDYRSKRVNLAKKNTPKDLLVAGRIALQDTDYLEQQFAERWSFIKNPCTRGGPQ